MAQLRTLAGSFFEFTAGNNAVLPLTTNVEMGVENHILFQLEYAPTPHRPLKFTAHGLRRSTDSTYGTIFSFWDRWFGTTTPTERRQLMPLGVEGQEELPMIALIGRPTARDR